METPDPFDPAALRLNEMFVEGVPIKKYLSTIPVRKPGRQDFVRVHPAEEWRLTPAAILELKEDREVYLVRPHLVNALTDEVSPATIYTAITRQGTLFLWPVRLPTADGRRSDWHRSALEGAELAQTKWLRITANLALGAYEFAAALNGIADPDGRTSPFRKSCALPSVTASSTAKIT